MVKVSLPVLGKPGLKVTEKPPQLHSAGQRLGELENMCGPQGRVNSWLPDTCPLPLFKRGIYLSTMSLSLCG